MKMQPAAGAIKRMAEKFTTLKLDATGDKAGASATTVRPQIGTVSRSLFGRIVTYG